MQALKRGFSAAFGVDTRSLSLYRVCLSCVVVLDLLDRLRDLRAHYSDEGYWPRRVAIQYAGEDSHLCVHMLNGSVGFAAILFAIHFMFAVAMFVGYRTRLATFLVWFMTTSLQSRNYFVGHSGDTYLRMMLFWSIFMPMGEHFSLDRLRNNASAKDKAAYIYVGVGSVGALFQLMYVYTGSALEKRTRAWDAWFREGEATYWALHSIPYFLTSFGVLMAGLDKSVLRLMTWSVLAWEAVGPFTLMSPWKTEKLRMVGVIGTFMLHFGFALCMKLEEFVWLGCTAAFFALPSTFWDSMVPRMIPKSRAKTDVTLQHSASFLSLARTLEVFLLIPNLRLTRTLDEEEGGHSSVEGHGHALTLYAPDGRTLHDADALIGVLALSPVAWPLSKVKQPWHMLFTCYRVLLLLEVAEALYPEDAPRSPRTKRRPANATTLHMFLQIYFSGTLWLNVIGACCVVWVLLWNLGNVGLGYMPGFFYAFGQPMMLDQTWNMFAPPPKHVTWHLIELHLKSGPPQELIKAGGLWHWRSVPLHNTPPEPLYYNYGNHRNFKYWENYSFSSQNIDSRLEFGRWICREWNSRHTGDAVLQSHKTHYYYTPADLPPDEQLQKAQTEVMWDHSCF